MNKTARFGFGVFVAAAMVGLIACEQVPGPAAPSSTAVGVAGGAVEANANINSDLAPLRRALARFHDFDAAGAAGWDTQITPCLTLAGQGGQGFHYGNTALIDGAITALQPELLLYEPRGNKLHLVGVEYIIPFDLWEQTSPPALYGETFHRNEALGLWVLHVWIWKPNPSGMFADWNPNVSCNGA